MLIKNLLSVFAAFFLLNAFVFSQNSSPTPTPSDDSINVFTEEVHLNVTAQTSGGKFVKMLKPDDLLIVEEGTPQKIESMKQIPASVLLLLDTGGNLNFAKRLDSIKLTAKLLTENISDGNSLAVMQSYDKLETVADWTENKTAIQAALDQKLFSGNRSRFADSINYAVELFKSRPLENRHLVFIGDGLDSIASADERAKAFQKLLAANITTHVIAYNKMEADEAEKSGRNYQFGEKVQKPRVPEHVLENMLQGMPPAMRDNFRRFMEARRIFIIRLDRKAVKLARQKREDWMKSETELKTLAENTGGMFHSPEETETMWTFAIDVARAIGSQYVITYVPTKSFSESRSGDERKVRVGTHCDGVQIRSRQKIVVP